MRRLFAACDGVPLRLMPTVRRRRPAHPHRCARACSRDRLTRPGVGRPRRQRDAARPARVPRQRLLLGAAVRARQHRDAVRGRVRDPLCGSPFGAARGTLVGRRLRGAARGPRPPRAAACATTRRTARTPARSATPRRCRSRSTPRRAAAARSRRAARRFLRGLRRRRRAARPGDRGAEYRSFIGVPSGAANAAGLGLANITAARDAHAPIMELRVGAGDEDDVDAPCGSTTPGAPPFHPRAAPHQQRRRRRPRGAMHAGCAIQMAAGRIKRRDRPRGTAGK